MPEQVSSNDFVSGPGEGQDDPTGRFLKTGLVLMAGAMVGFLAPLALFFTDMFPGGPPTLEAQYILKDIVLATAAMVIAARALGARMVAAREAV
ncbi:hypothetical protein [Nonomuraea terrae]|uniref:hypothetical protein n=1 Tax=Nonomuraea terrae TaxID=2530383 RepID=UPI001651B4B8|nr:hypothetical protein [Nonomuraea terrae]